MTTQRTIPREAMDQMLAIRAPGRVNMLSRYDVLDIAVELGFSELLFWNDEDNGASWGPLIFGNVPIEEEGT